MANVYILEAEVKPVHGAVEASVKYIDFRGYPLIRASAELAGASLFNRKSDAERHLDIYQKQLVIGENEFLSVAMRSLVGKGQEDFSAEVNLSIIQINGHTLLGATIACAHRVTLRVEQFDEGKDTSVEVLSARGVAV